MRNRLVAATALTLAAVPAWAQSPVDVTGPRMLTPSHLACTDLPITAKPEPRLVIKGVHSTDGRTLVGEGSVVAIGRSADDGLAPGQRYVIRRLQGDPKAFPREGEGFGAVRTAGFLTVTAVDEHNALATIDYACDGVVPGDYLEVYAEPLLPTSASEMVHPDFSDRATVLPGPDTRELFGDGDTFSIDRGTVNGVVAGMRYAIYRDHRIDDYRHTDHRDGIMPLVYMADAVVMEVGERTSKVVIVKGVNFVEVGDVAVPRRQP